MVIPGFSYTRNAAEWLYMMRAHAFTQTPVVLSCSVSLISLINSPRQSCGACDTGAPGACTAACANEKDAARANAWVPGCSGQAWRVVMHPSTSHLSASQFSCVKENGQSISFHLDCLRVAPIQSHPIPQHTLLSVIPSAHQTK